MSELSILKEFMEYRCGIYYWLKDLYSSEPSLAVLKGIKTTCEAVSFEDLPEAELAFMQLFQSLNEEELLNLEKEIRFEYARLFIGPKKVLVPPYESTYRENKKSIFGRNTTLVRELYHNAGLKLAHDLNIPDDFIGYELEFMYYLCYQTLEALEANDTTLVQKLLAFQHYFLTEHLGKWIEAFTQDIIKETNLAYFNVLASFTCEFIIMDQQQLTAFNE